jgi:predicted dehydrogenase
MKIFNAAVIGYGFMGKTHIYGYRTIPLYYRDLPYRINLSSICSGTYENALKAKEDFGFDKAVRDADEIFNDPSIDIVNICTPNHLHYEQLKMAIENKKHIYCDKPLTVTADEAREIAESAGKRGIVAQVAFNYRFLPPMLRAKQLIEEGKIGKPLSFRAEYLHSGSLDPDKAPGWKQLAKFGGGVIVDLGSHVIDLMYYLLGEYKSLTADSTILYPNRKDKSGNTITIDAEDSFMMMVKMKNGSKGIIEASKIATGTDDELRFEIHGDKGALKFNLMQPNYLEYFSSDDSDMPYGGDRGFKSITCVQRYEQPGGGFPSPKNSIGWLRGHVHSLYKFTESVYSGKPASPDFYEGAYIQQVMDKVVQSINLSSWVEV